MSPIQRWELTETGSPYQPWREMQRTDNGDWVSHDDHVAAVATLEAENARLRGIARKVVEWVGHFSQCQMVRARRDGITVDRDYCDCGVTELCDAAKPEEKTP